MCFSFGYIFIFIMQAAVKNVLGQAGQIAGKTKNVESVTGLFKGITGKQGAEKLLSGVAVSLSNVDPWLYAAVCILKACDHL